MYSSIRITGYRGLDSFRMKGLFRVNLLVGTNMEVRGVAFPSG